MPDLRLRQLERQAAQGGIEERAALLRERLRRGEQSGVPCSICKGTGDSAHQLRQPATPGGSYYVGPLGCAECSNTGRTPLRVGVELAAYFGDETAQRAFGEWPPAPTGWWVPETFKAWLAGLVHNSHWGREVSVCAAIAAARVALVAWEASGQAYGMSTANPGMGVELLPRRALEAVEAWVVEPNEEHARRWGLLWSQASQPWLPRPIRSTDRWREGTGEIRDAARLIPCKIHTQPCLGNCGAVAVRTAIKRELVPWALGEGDPIKERVSQRNV